MAQLLTETEAADYLGVSPRTLSNFRTRGGGPDYIKVGSKSVRYDLKDLQEYIADRRQNSTSEDLSDDKFDDEDEGDYDDYED